MCAQAAAQRSREEKEKKKTKSRTALDGSGKKRTIQSQGGKVTKKSNVVASGSSTDTESTETENTVDVPDDLPAQVNTEDTGSPGDDMSTSDKEEEAEEDEEDEDFQAGSSGVYAGGESAANRASAGQIASWDKVKSDAVEGFGCPHCSFKTMKLDERCRIDDQGYLGFEKKEGRLLYQSSCGGGCGLLGEDLKWKDRNKFTGCCAYYCRFNYLLTGDEALDTHCPWYCLKCTDIMEEKEEEARRQQEGGGSSGRRTRNRR